MRKECYECTYNYGNMYVATMNLFIAYTCIILYTIINYSYNYYYLSKEF